MPRSSIDVLVEFKNRSSATKTFKLENYLSIPPPRTTRIELIKQMLAAQYPSDVPDANDIARIVFMPFVQGGIVKGRSTSGATESAVTVPHQDHRSQLLRHDGSIQEEELSSSHHREADTTTMDDSNAADPAQFSRFTRPRQEMSLRFPCIQIPGFKID
jgi:hypothetical protein